MRGINKVILLGTLGNDPKINAFSNGGKVANFSIATSEVWTDKNTGERKEQTEWHRITLNNRLAEIAQQYLKKGSKVYIEGSLRTRQWTDQNGQERYVTEVRGDQLQMLDSRNMQQDNGYPQNTGYNATNTGFSNQNNGYAPPQDNFQSFNNNNAAPGYNNTASVAPKPMPINNNEPDDDLPF